MGRTDSVILGLGQTHNASACLVRDGVVVACASEERFNRIKNTTAFPVRAVQYVLEQGGVQPDAVTDVVHSYRHAVPNFAFANDSVGQAVQSALTAARMGANYALAVAPRGERLLRGTYTTVTRAMRPSYERRFGEMVGEKIGVPAQRVRMLDHHYCHAAAGYGFYLAQGRWGEPALIFTLDAEGDGKAATVSIGHRGRIHLAAATPAGRSIGVLYGAVTEWLGMRMNEHEYKVMGLAPYAPAPMVEKVVRLLDPLIVVDGLTFRTKVSSGAFRHLLDRRLRGSRFDAVAGAVQLLLERRVTEWVRNAVVQHSITNVILSGGVFMNVKASKAVMEMPEVASIVVCPSAADESTPLGAAIATHLECQARSQPLTLRDLYLGPEASDEEVEIALKKADAFARYEVARIPAGQEAGVIAALLAQGKIVARFAGRMEFGARALGNRSILAHPSRRDMVRTINEQIKGRDFWMPFGCSILAEAENSYLVNPKGVPAPFMAMAFDTLPGSRDDIVAGIHPYDFTIRPQLVTAASNGRYHAIIAAFRALTGVGAVLNTSFNLHGEPLVCGPSEALDVFARSGLTILQLDQWLVRKKPTSADAP